MASESYLRHLMMKLWLIGVPLLGSLGIQTALLNGGYWPYNCLANGIFLGVYVLLNQLLPLSKWERFIATSWGIAALALLLFGSFLLF